MKVVNKAFIDFLRRAIQMNPKMKLEGVYELNFSLDVIHDIVRCKRYNLFLSNALEL